MLEFIQVLVIFHCQTFQVFNGVGQVASHIHTDAVIKSGGQAVVVVDVVRRQRQDGKIRRESSISAMFAVRRETLVTTTVVATILTTLVTMLTALVTTILTTLVTTTAVPTTLTLTPSFGKSAAELTAASGDCAG